MTRTVQLTLTLDVAVYAVYSTRRECWTVSDISEVLVDGRSIDLRDNRLGELLLNDDKICQELADLYSQQEP